MAIAPRTNLPALTHNSCLRMPPSKPPLKACPRPPAPAPRPLGVTPLHRPPGGAPAPRAAPPSAAPGARGRRGSRGSWCGGSARLRCRRRGRRGRKGAAWVGWGMCVWGGGGHGRAGPSRGLGACVCLGVFFRPFSGSHRPSTATTHTAPSRGTHGTALPPLGARACCIHRMRTATRQGCDSEATVAAGAGRLRGNRGPLSRYVP